jgi:hypothetical protein
MTLYISVNKHVIKKNIREGRNDPPYEVRKSKNDRNPMRVHEMSFNGTLRLVYNPVEPLVSRAVCWIEVTEPENEPSQPTSAPDSSHAHVTIPAPTAEQIEYFRRLRDSHVAYDPTVTIGGPRPPADAEFTK